MEYCKGGDICDKLASLENFGEPEAAQILHSVFLAVHYLHVKGICHRDLRLENVMFVD